MFRTWNKAYQSKWNVFVQDPGIKELFFFDKKHFYVCECVCYQLIYLWPLNFLFKMQCSWKIFRIAFQLKNPLGVVTVKFTENTVEGNDQKQFLEMFGNVENGLYIEYKEKLT